MNKGTFIEEARRVLQENGLRELDSPKFMDAVERLRSEITLAECAMKAMSTVLEKYEGIIEEVE